MKKAFIGNRRVEIIDEQFRNRLDLIGYYEGTTRIGSFNYEVWSGADEELVYLYKI